MTLSEHPKCYVFSCSCTSRLGVPKVYWIKIDPVASWESGLKISSYIFLCATWSQPFQWSAYVPPCSESLVLLWIWWRASVFPSLGCDILHYGCMPLVFHPRHLTPIVRCRRGALLFHFTFLFFFIFSLRASEIKCYTDCTFLGETAFLGLAVWGTAGSGPLPAGSRTLKRLSQKGFGQV